MKRPHAGRLARWYGDDQLAALGDAMRGWYGPPIVLGAAPNGATLHIHPDGDISGDIGRAGAFASMLDALDDAVAVASRRALFGAGFSGLLNIVERATLGGRRQAMPFTKSMTSSSPGGSNDVWLQATIPAAGSAAAAAPAGTVFDTTSAGAFPISNAKAGETLHFAGGQTSPGAAAVSGTVAALLLYDRLWGASKTMNSTAAEAVTGVPTRYQGAPGSADSAEGNFVLPSVITSLPATAHNWAGCTYVDENGAAQTLPTWAGISGATTGRIDTASTWFLPLADGNVGVRALTNMQCDALVATGAINFVIGHPIGWLPSTYFSGLANRSDGIRRPLQMARVFDGAALGLLEVHRMSAGSTTYAGHIDLISG